MDKYLKHLIKQSHKYVFDQKMDFWLLAMIVSGGRILSIAANEHKKSMFVDAYYASHCNAHAELGAIKQVRRKIDLRGAKMYVLRVQRDHCTLALARPCPSCQELLLAYGIKKVIYTISASEYGVLNLGRDEDLQFRS